MAKISNHSKSSKEIMAYAKISVRLKLGVHIALDVLGRNQSCFFE
jgi:hypothetical protein